MHNHPERLKEADKKLLEETRLAAANNHFNLGCVIGGPIGWLIVWTILGSILDWIAGEQGFTWGLIATIPLSATVLIWALCQEEKGFMEGAIIGINILLIVFISFGLLMFLPQ